MSEKYAQKNVEEMRSIGREIENLTGMKVISVTYKTQGADLTVKEPFSENPKIEKENK